MTIETNDVVERLRKEAPHAMGWAEQYDSPSCYLVCKLALQAADTIERLREEKARVRELDIAKLAEKCAVACQREMFPSTATFETRIEEVLRAALTSLGGAGEAKEKVPRE